MKTRTAQIAALLLVATASTTAAETIMQIQGASHRSPLAGRRVSGVQGIVTARAGNGFYLQDAAGDGDPATSDALFVYTGGAPTVAIGDAVEVAGTVFEYRPGCSSAATLDDETCSDRSAAFHNLSVTELVWPSIAVRASGRAPPPAAWIGGPAAAPPAQIGSGLGGSVEDPLHPFDAARHALDFFETLEGMRVVVAAPLVVGPRGGAGVLPVLADLGAASDALTGRGGVALTAASANGDRVLLDDLFMATPLADTGDTLPDVEGIVDFRSGGYRVQITRPVTASENSPPPQTASAEPPGSLSIAAFNVENLAATSTAAKIDALARQIAANLGGPALVALAEMQDDSGAIDDGMTSGVATFGVLATAIAAAGGPAYQFVQIDPEDGASGGAPGANIRVGFLYDPLRVTLVRASQLSPEDPAWIASRVPLAATFRVRGRPLVAIALHLRSKSGDGPLFGRFQPPIEPSRDARAEQADAVARFVESTLAADPGAAVVVLGDFNDFDFAPALARLEAAELRNLTRRLAEPARYTFVFDGNAQALDHVLVSDALATGARYEIVHVNSEYRAGARGSDHDPVLVRLALPAPEPRAAALGIAVGSVLLGLARRAHARSHRRRRH